MSELTLVVRSTVILAAGLAVVAASRRASASTRSLWLALTFGALFFLPFASATLPQARIPVALPAPAALSQSQRPSITTARAELSVLDATPKPRRPAVTFGQGLAGVWLAGAGLAALPLGVALISASRLKRRGTVWLRGTETLRMLMGGAAVSRPVRVVRDPTVCTPCTIGFIRPVIVFPADAGDWSDDDIRRVLIHEHEHVRRGDWLIVLAARFACALYWFHPLTWCLLRRLRVETERACDDAVVRASDALAYAEQLVNLASQLSARTSAALVLPIASGSELSVRVSSILDGGRRRGRTTAAGRWAAFASSAALAAIVAAAAPVSVPVHAARQQPGPPGAIVPPETANYGAEVTNGAAVSGTLFDPFGQPLAGVVLGLESLQFGNPPVPPRSTPFFRTTRTDANGRYSFTRVPPGLYGLASPDSDFVPGAQLVLRLGERVTRDIRMKMSPATATVTACRDCPPGAPLLDLPDSIRQELDRDEQLALSAPVAAAAPVSKALSGEITASYPDALRDSDLQGRVAIEGVIGADGNSLAMRVTSSTDPALTAAALDIVASEHWRPALVQGTAVASPFRVDVDFVLK